MNTSVMTMSSDKKILSNGVLGMLIFVFTEVMFFTAMISSFIVIRAGAGKGFAIPGDIKLPVEITAFNTGVLLLSGLYLWGVGNQVKDGAKSSPQMLRAIILGAFFVLVQGVEWARLLSYGLSMGTSIFGACFYLIIGTHGLHAIAGIIAMAYVWWRERKDLQLNSIRVLQIFWFFVCGIWPLLYGLIYF